MHLFSPNHVQLCNACYPPTSTLLTSGPDYSPNSQELSRLTYYASNHPGKLTKLGGELEKRVRAECRKARTGNTRSRASLLITLSIFRALATECRRDISLLSPALVASVEFTLSSLPTDLEVVARAASVFTAWTTYTDGHVIGVDSNVTRDYLSTLRKLSELSSAESKTQDHEVRNRTRLIGFAAITGALNSEALYNDFNQFRAQVSVIMCPVLVTLVQTDLSVLDAQASAVKELPTSPYLAEFRTRPAMERRAASIHVHIDGDKGPSMADVANACMRALFSLLEHANGAQLGYIMRASFDSLDELNEWAKLEHLCWFAQKVAEWSQYQYRYAVPTQLVERLLEGQDAATPSYTHTALASMITTVFNSPTPLVNLSTSDIISNLITLLLRRIRINANDALLPAIVECIASLGRHVYYSDQIQDLAGELVSRLVIVEAQHSPGRGENDSVRPQAIRCLLAGLLGLIQAANKNDLSEDERRKKGASLLTKRLSNGVQDGRHERISGRTRVPTDIWQESLGLLCDGNAAVRADYANALVFYLVNEMPKRGDVTDVDGVKRVRRLAEAPLQQATNLNHVLRGGDIGTKFLHAIHAYLYILATTSTLDVATSSGRSSAHSSSDNGPVVNVSPPTPQAAPSEGDPINPPDSPGQSQGNGRRSLAPSHVPRARKMSVVHRLLERIPSHVSATAAASLRDYSHILELLTTVHEQLPVRGFLTGIPMLLALDGTTNVVDADDCYCVQRANTINEVIARVWLVIAKVWECSDLLDVVEKALLSIPVPSYLPSLPTLEAGVYHQPESPIPFPTTKAETFWSGVDSETALTTIVSNPNVQEATGLDRHGLLRRFANKWSPDSAFKDSIERSASLGSARGDGISPLLKISPALMHIENISLQSLARSTRGVGVTDLREALEGRSSMSNSALARPPSISTLDHTTAGMGGDIASNRLGKTRSRTKSNKRSIPSGTGEVRDVLNRLGIGKQNGSLLKASFPALQKSPELRAPNNT